VAQNARSPREATGISHEESAMTAPQNRVELPHSARTPIPGAHPIGPADPHERIEVTVRLRPRQARPSIEALASTPVRERRYLTHAEFEAQHGTDPEDIRKVEEFAAEHDLTVVQASSARHTVILGGTVAAFSAGFGVQLQQYESPGGRHRGRVGTVSVPADLAPIVEGVFGLDDRPQAQPHFRRTNPVQAAAAANPSVGLSPTDVAKHYNYPQGVTGQGQTIALIELGGGFRTTDLKTYFNEIGVPLPKVVAVSVSGGHNHPTNAQSADGEVMLDIEVAGAVAPGAQIAVYFAPNTDAGFLNAITTAIHDTQRSPSIISISWGGPENAWTAQAMQAMDQAFQSAAALGISVYCAAGDNGSTDGVNDGQQHVDFPASSQHATACGGTQLLANDEVVWNNMANNEGATGGGVSAVFPLPSYQAQAGVPKSANPGGAAGRGVPDISGDASPVSGYRVRVDGQEMPIGGTSAVAPLWAGLTALLNQGLKARVGFINTALYTRAATGVLKDITNGNNGAYNAGPGWDACTGLGSPDGAKLLSVL
jgi:kumamolisin